MASKKPPKLTIEQKAAAAITKARNAVVRRAAAEAAQSSKILLLDQLASGDSLYFKYNKILDITVADGDTLKATIDLGFHNRTIQYLRVARVDLPEHDTVAGAACKELLQLIFSTLYIKSIETKAKDKYGRWLTEFELAEVANLSDRLLQGYIGRPYKGDRRKAWTEADLRLSCDAAKLWMVELSDKFGVR